VKRTFDLTPDLLRRYSRRGNFHSDPEAAGALGYERLIAQGMQVAGPAYGLLLDAWGEEFLAHGSFELKFVGVATDGETVEARVEPGVDDATIEVQNVTSGRTSVVGQAMRTTRTGNEQ
jgi:acyl dehydratase